MFYICCLNNFMYFTHWSFCGLHASVSRPKASSHLIQRGTEKSSVYLPTELSSSRTDVMNSGGRWSAFSLCDVDSKFTGLRYKWNCPKPASIAKALYNLETKTHGCIWKINFLLDVSNTPLEPCIHHVHFNETSASNLKHFLASERVWWLWSKQVLYPNSWWLLSVAWLVDTDSTYKQRTVSCESTMS